MRIGPLLLRLRAAPTRHALYCAAALPFAFHVHESAATAVQNDAAVAENERFEKRWQLGGGSAYAINRVHVNVPGLTCVSYEEPAVSGAAAAAVAISDFDSIAAVRVSGDSRATVDCVEVVPLPPNGVELRYKSDAHCAALRGHLLTVLTVRKEAQVTKLRASGGGTVVVKDGVLLSDCDHASVQLASEGRGDLFVTSQRDALNLRQLRLSTIGTGSVQFVGPSHIQVRDLLLLEVGGAGKIRFFGGQIGSKLFKSTIAGSGDITVSASDRIDVDKLKTSIAGSGKVKYEGDGQCRVQRCSITGSGEVVARDIQSEEASITALGESDVTLRMDKKLTVSGWSSTTVRYVGDVPTIVEGKTVTLRQAAPPVTNDKTTAGPEMAPSPKDAFGAIEAVNESKTSAMETNSGLGNAARYLVNAFLGS